MATSAENRVLMAFDGEFWFVRRIRVIEHDLEADEKIYHCDQPIAGPLSLNDAIAVVRHLADLREPR